MKKYMVCMFVFVLLLGCSVQQRAGQPPLDWAGTYIGTMPCADCEGILTTITLNKDKTFSRTDTYLGKEDATFAENGTLRWNPADSTIRLQGDPPALYRVGNNALTRLDADGQAITGELAEHYVLRKQISLETDLTGGKITTTRWKLVELMGKPVPANASGKFPFITLNAASVRFTGFGGCNTVSGAYELKVGNRLRFTDMAVTQMACMDMGAERQFFEVLSMVDNFACDGKILSLHKARMAPLARFEAAPEN